ncbi:hypothetical protein LPJ53_004837 [Coemansia erecta]|uniref:Chitosanase n=1 Tax=Coemansia erecta TaxID=147472 RepID=A0A9W7XXN4_9FUNG|nr:hypothetical protein LPJ53_004837 [Coemansia erecta]
MKTVLNNSILGTGVFLSLCTIGSAGLTDCSKNLAFQLTNLFQLDSIQFDYANCGEDDTGNGFAAGIVNFCTGTGDAWQVIEAYHNITGGDDEFTSLDKTLAAYAEDGNGSTAGIENFCGLWAEASKKQAFMDAQNQVLEALYFDPSQTYADSVNLTLSVTQAQLYDTAISHGASDSYNSLGGMISLTNSRFSRDIPGNSTSTLQIGGFNIDEIEWLKEFLNVRAGYSVEGDATNSIRAYILILQLQEYSWTDQITVLDNDDKQVVISCADSYMPSADSSSSSSPSSQSDDEKVSSSSSRSRSSRKKGSGSGSDSDKTNTEDDTTDDTKDTNDE